MLGQMLKHEPPPVQRRMRTRAKCASCNFPTWNPSAPGEFIDRSPTRDCFPVPHGSRCSPHLGPFHFRGRSSSVPALMTCPPCWVHVVTWNLRNRRINRGHIEPRCVAISSDGGDYIFYLDTGVPGLESPVVALGPGLNYALLAPTSTPSSLLVSTERFLTFQEARLMGRATTANACSEVPRL